MAKRDLIKTNYPSIRSMFESQDLQDQLSRTIPSLMDLDMLIRVSLTTIRTNPDLLECSQQSLMACVFGCGTLGLSPEPFLGQAYFVPFYNSRIQQNEATLIPGYKGMVTLWRRSGEGHNLASEVVFEKDVFKYDLIQWSIKNYHSFTHIPTEEEDPGEMRGAWCILGYQNGAPTFDYMNRRKILKRKDATKARNKKGEIVGPWIDWPEEMYRKTVIKYALKLAPLSIEDNRIVKAAHAEDLALSGQDQKSFFLPDIDAPIEIPKAGAANVRQEEADQRADFNQWSLTVDDLQLKNFIEICAAQNGLSNDEVIGQAAENLDNFKNAFEKWKATVDRHVNGEEAFINEWRNLQKPGFAPYVKENLDQFRSCSDDTKAEAIAKWNRLYPGEKWPGSKVESENEGHSTGEGEIGASAASEAGAESNLESIFPKLMKLKADNAAIYLEVTQGHSPKTAAEMQSVIDKMEKAIADRENQSGGIPGS